MKIRFFALFIVAGVVIESSALVSNENANPPPVAEALSTGAKLYWYPAESLSNRSICVIVCPGGAYSRTCITYEGWAIAEWLNSIDISAAVLDYHTTQGTVRQRKPLLDLPLRDLQSAIRSVRTRYNAKGIATCKIGVLGFSAGGHLAATAMTSFSNETRPDFGILGYALTDYRLNRNDPIRSSQINLLGESALDEDVRRFSPAKNVTKETPPVFIFSTDCDKVVSCEQAIAFYLACRKVGVPAELHIWQKGVHGGGLCRDRPGEDRWPMLCEIWLKNMGF